MNSLRLLFLITFLIAPLTAKAFAKHKISKRFGKKVIENAIQIWQQESGRLLRFVDISPVKNWSTDPTTNANTQRRVAHIDIFFAKYNHGDGEDFDGAGGLVAHSAYPETGVVHFDGSEKWSLEDKIDIQGDNNWNTKAQGDNEMPADEYINLPYVALHELGHVIGIRHSSFNKSVMNPFYRAKGVPHLSKDDVEAVRELYEHCAAKNAF